MWRFVQEHEALWRSVIDVKYGIVRGGWSCQEEYWIC
jgi:hypothetical protein